MNKLHRLQESVPLRLSALALVGSLALSLSACGQTTEAAPAPAPVGPEQTSLCNPNEYPVDIFTGEFVLDIPEQRQLLQGDTPSDVGLVAAELLRIGVEPEYTLGTTRDLLPPQGPGDQVYEVENAVRGVLGKLPLPEEPLAYAHDKALNVGEISIGYLSLGICLPESALQVLSEAPATAQR